MKYRVNEQGSIVHIIIVTLLALVLLGALGFLFWQNVVSRGSSGDAPSTEMSADQYSGWGAYTFQDAGVKFRYPTAWEVSYFSPDKQSGRTAPLVLMTYDSDTVLPGGVTDFLWPSVEVYDPDTGRAPSIGTDSEVVYSEKFANATRLVCTYRDGPELPGDSPVQRLTIQLVGEAFDEGDVVYSSALVKSGDGRSLIISGGSIGYRDRSLSKELAKRLCESPQPEEYTAQVILWLKSIELPSKS